VRFSGKTADLSCVRRNGNSKPGGERGFPQLDNRRVFPAFEIRGVKLKLHVFVFYHGGSSTF
jgi:hypothetical protein